VVRWCLVGPLLGGVWLGGCASAVLGRSDLLDFLEAGGTTRHAVTQKLGPPDAMYEGGRIVTYWIEQDEGGYYRRRPFSSAAYSLVLVFHSDDVLAKQSLVKVRGP
jgi:hypothetical protein